MKLFGRHIHWPFALLAAGEFGAAGIAFLASFWFLTGVGGGVEVRNGAVVWPWMLAFCLAVPVGVTAMRTVEVVLWGKGAR